MQIDSITKYGNDLSGAWYVLFEIKWIAKQKSIHTFQRLE